MANELNRLLPYCRLSFKTMSAVRKSEGCMAEEKSIGKQIIHEIGEWLYAIIIALAIAIVVHLFLGQITRVSGESMEDTLHNGDFLVVSKWDHIRGNMPQYGEIVIIDSRANRERTWEDDVTDVVSNYMSIFSKSAERHDAWVKRVIGLPGDTLEFKAGHVWRNGKELEEPYTKEPTMQYSQTAPVVVPEGHVFVMGDNRNHSSDSRFIGPVPIKNVIGHVVYDFSF